MNNIAEPLIGSNHMDDIKPVAFVNLELWLSGNCWPDECFNEAKTGNIETPLYPESALLQAREEGRLKGLREASEALLIICRAAEGK